MQLQCGTQILLLLYWYCISVSEAVPLGHQHCQSAALKHQSGFSLFSSSIPLVDRPTQLIHIGISICWVGGGDPCGAADFCFSGVYCHKKQAWSDFFSKYPCRVHKDCLEEEKWDEKLGKTSKKPACFKPFSPLALNSRNVAATNQDKQSLAWDGPARIKTNWFWLEMLQHIRTNWNFPSACH